MNQLHLVVENGNVDIWFLFDTIMKHKSHINTHDL